jgi:hypothetical protein
MTAPFLKKLAELEAAALAQSLVAEDEVCQFLRDNTNAIRQLVEAAWELALSDPEQSNVKEDALIKALANFKGE